MAKGLNLNVDKCVERLTNKFPQMEEYKPESEMSAKNGKYATLRIVNENELIPSLYLIVSQRGGIMLRFGDMMLCCEYPDVDPALTDMIYDVLSDRLVAVVNYENIIYYKHQIPRQAVCYSLDDEGENGGRAQYDKLMAELGTELTGIKRLFDKHKGITFVYNWSGSVFEKFER